MDRTFVLTFLFSIAAVRGMRVEDQGRWDWKKEGILGPLRSFELGCDGKHHLTLDATGTLSALKDEDGKRAWRREVDPSDGIWMTKEGIPITSHRGGRLLRAWDSESGFLVWEQNEHGVGTSVELKVGAEGIFEVFDKDVGSRGVRIRDGKVVWRNREREEDERDSWTMPTSTVEWDQVDGGIRFRSVAGKETTAVLDAESLESRGRVLLAKGSVCEDEDRVMLFMEDHSMIMLIIPKDLGRVKIKWTREDALSSITNVLFLDLPDAKAPFGMGSSDAMAPTAEGWKDFFKMHLLQAKMQAGWQTPQEHKELRQMQERNSDKNRLTRDHNGFRKILLVLTAPGKVFALHNGDGRILWSNFLPGQWTHMFHWTTAHLTTSPPELLLLGKGGGEKSMAVVLNAYTGDVVWTKKLDHSVRQAFALPSSHLNQRNTFVIVDEQDHVFLFPDAEEGTRALTELEQDIHYYNVDTRKGEASGYRVGYKAGSSFLESLELWRYVVPKNEKILSVAYRRPEDTTYTQIKVLGDRQLLYKYVNPNTMFLVTGDGVAGEDCKITCSVIDTITGAVLHTEYHRNAAGPVSSVMSENWIVFAYVDTVSGKDILSVLELYERPKRKPLSTWEMMEQKLLVKEPLSLNYSSFDPPRIKVLSKSFFSPVSIKQLQVTTTLRGITAKDVLLATHSDQVLAVPKRMLDPRRPEGKPNQDEREELLIQYDAKLPFMPQKYATYSHVVSGLRQVTVAPAYLESTCLFFAIGIDVFYGRLTPSNTFDRLGENFSHAFLLFTILGLVVGTYFLGKVLKGRELASKWA